MIVEGIADPVIERSPREPGILYRSERTRVERCLDSAAGTSVIKKILLGPDAAARLHHEARMLERLEDVPGVSRLLSVGPGPVLVLQDTGGASLAGRAPLRPSIVLDLGLNLARIVACIHRHGILHLDISPANIICGSDPKAPLLIDFHLATLAEEGRRGFTHHTEIAGTLAYIAPELTGRLGQGVDHRADLYALGATLYELLTGEPPFGRGDPLRLLRDVIAAVPAPPAARVPDLPPLLSDIIMRLLEKEPDRRYQSADGLADDLDALAAAAARGETGGFALGASDFPLRLLAPSRLICRDGEVAALRAAFDAALHGGCNLLLISGAAGTGKTTLIDQFRPIVTAQGGWFVTGSFEPIRKHKAADPLLQVMRRIAGLLLAEPDAELAVVQANLRSRLGEDVSLLASVIPEMAALFGDAAAPADAAEARSDLVSLAFLRAVVSETRPMVMAFDNLQWATATGLKRIESLLASDRLPGLLVVGAYRDGDVDEPSPLVARLARWQTLAISPRAVKLQNLPPEALTDMVGDMLRLTPEAARDLAAVIGARTGGNPSETLDLLNGLRRGNALVRGATGWLWDGAEIRRHVSDTELSERLAARIIALPEATQNLLADMACLGNHLAPALVSAATGTPLVELDGMLEPALTDGLLILEQGALHTRPTLRFRNEPVQRAIDDMMAARNEDSPAERRHLAMARRLSRVADHELATAEQYLVALPAIQAPVEALRAVDLFIAAGRASALTQRHDEAESYYAAAIILRERFAASDLKELTRLRTARLTALYSLGRHDDADQLFVAIMDGESDPLALAEATCVEVLSMCNRGRHREAIATGLAILERLGISRPAGDLMPEVARGLAAIPAWLATETATRRNFRAVTRDPLIRAAARLINRLLPPAQLLDTLVGAWLALESLRLWARHGVCPEVIASLARSAAAPNVFGADYQTGYDMARHAVALGTEYGYEPETSLARQNFATFSLHWFERLENTAEQVAAANAGLVAAGEIQAACINYISSLAALFDCAPTLEAYGGELTKARDFTARTGNDQLFESFHSHFRLLQTLTGATDAATSLAAAKGPALTGKPLATFGFHCSQAILSALFDDQAGLALHSAAAMPLLSRIGGAYRCVVASLLRAVSIAWEMREGGGDAAFLAGEFAALRDWFAGRAADTTGNFEHMLHFIDAQAAWTKGDVPMAIQAFDRALQFCSRQSRPWHHALIAEQAGVFHLAHGFDYVGRALLTDARDRYAAWGASAVVRRLTATHGFLDAIDARQALAKSNSTSWLSADAVDLLGILRTSQVLSSQTNIGALRALVVETLAEMTAATAVVLVVRDEQRQIWCLPAERDEPGEPIELAASRGDLPLSALRYVERTGEALVVDDARLDERFSRDPYFSALRRCSLLVMPVQSQGKMRGILLLENRLKSGVFSQTRLNLVALIAGQLAVSLDNALLYASLERRVAERTEALAAANRKLEALSLSDGLTGLSNRRRFDAVLESEWRRAARAATGLGLIMIDIDYFKRYNDHYGHVRGDHCLRSVATVLRASIRQDVDLVARYGGEEFAIILPGADLAFARGVAERVHAAVIALREPHAGSPLGNVTVSLGVAAMFPTRAAGREPLIEQADAALYLAKQAGRNRLES